MPVHDHLLQVQRTLYDRFRTSARQSVGTLSPTLRKYYLEYQREFSDYTGVSSRSELLHAFIRSDILICGDYHTLRQAQRTALRLLVEAVEAVRLRGKHPVLALEMLRHSDTGAAALYLSGELDESRFLKQIRFDRNWGFQWENYRPLFKLAREKGIRVIGLNMPAQAKKPSLRQRDAFAATVLSDAMVQDPRLCVLAMMGDLHLSQGHLPAALEKELARRGKVRKVVVVHQNPERLYWKLAARGLEHEVGVVKLKKNVFCVMNTPPWVKLQSYLRWLEWSADPHADAPPSVGSQGEYVEDFLELVRTIQKSVGLERPIQDSFEIVWPGHSPSGSPATKVSTFQRKFRRALLSAIGSYFVPGEDAVYLSTPGVNGASTQASVYLHACLSGRWKSFEFPRQDFYSTIWVEALGFFGSKVINPHRRCYGPDDFSDAAKFSLLARRVTEHLSAERRGKMENFRGVALPAKVASVDRGVFYYRQARCLGQVLGAALYAAVVSDQVRASELQGLFRNPFTDGKKARTLYLKWARRLDRRGLRDALHRDRW
jgi:uncharacterized iron-regulated protein